MQIKDTFLKPQPPAHFDSMKEKLQKGDISGKIISETYLFEYTKSIVYKTSQTFETQGAVFDFKKIQEMLDSLDTQSLGYEGKVLSDLNPSEASALISDEGFFGIPKTSQRLIDFVFNGANDNLNLLKAGRSGMLQGLNEAELLWGGKLPDISYQTMDKVLQAVDERIASLGGNLLDTSI